MRWVVVSSREFSLMRCRVKEWMQEVKNCLETKKALSSKSKKNKTKCSL